MDSTAVARRLPAKLHPQGREETEWKRKGGGPHPPPQWKKSLSPSVLLCFTSEWRLPPCEDGVASRRASLSTPICSLLLRCEVEVRTARRRLQGSFFCLFRSWIEMGKKQQSSWKRNALSRKRMPRLNSNDCFDNIHPSLAFSIGVLENCVLCSISHIFFWTRQ